MNNPSKENPDDRPQPPQRMNSEERSNEEIRADLARAASPFYCDEQSVADRLAADVETLLARLAAVERERDEARREGREWVKAARVEERAEAKVKLGAALARIAAVEAEPAIGELAAQQSKMISGSYPPTLSGEAHMWRRCAKAGEEHGEVIEALLGFVGENPRKGVTADSEKVIKELLDEAFAALGAVEYLRGNDGSSGRLLAEHAQFVTGRLRAVLAASPTPTGPEPARCGEFNPGTRSWYRCTEPQGHDGDHVVQRPGFSSVYARWPGPATPEPTEETP